jgi:hypothetical protein
LGWDESSEHSLLDFVTERAIHALYP